MSNSRSLSSPHYSRVENQESEQSGSDDTTVPIVGPPAPRPRFRSPHQDPRRKIIEDSIDILRIVASRDADYAKQRNGEGFSKSDSEQGHILSKATLERALTDRQLANRIIIVGARYRRQAARLAQLELKL